MKIGDIIRQVCIFLLGVGLLMYDVFGTTRHDWVTIVVALFLMGTVPAEYLPYLSKRKIS